MRAFYLDTSALLKRYKSEAGSDNIYLLFDYSKRTRKRLITSIFTTVELASVSHRFMKQGMLSEAFEMELLQTFADDAEEYLRFVGIDDAIILSAAKAVWKHSLRAGDAIHFASLKRAREYLSTQGLDIVFVSSDNVLSQVTVEAGFRVANPQTASEKEWKEFLV